MNYSIRNATPEDAKDIAALHINAWRWAYKEKVPAGYLNSLSVTKYTRRWKKWLIKLQPSSRVYVATHAKKIIGFSHVGKSMDQDALESTGELFQLYIDKIYLKKGIGKALMHKGLEFLSKKELKKVTLWVMNSNVATISFYENFGWKPDGHTKTVNKGAFSIIEVRYTKIL